jgi:ferrous iron transport protein B
MARATFIMNRIMNTFGLHGKSFLPLMISTNGCAVPGIFATRILDSKRDRLITMLVVPFMVCGGKIPVFMFIINAFFSSKNRTRIMLLVYILSFVIAFAASKILSITFLKTEKANFIIELPPYHIPRIRSLFLRMWEMGWFYLKKAGIMIMLVSVLVWIIFSYPKVIIDENLPRNIRAELQLKHSLAGRIGKTFEPLFRPIGMDVNKSIALLAGIVAKEVIVSTLSTIYSIEKDSNLYNSKSLSEKISLNNDWSILKGLTFLVFCMIYTPCISCVVVFFKESGSSYKWLALIVIGNAIIAWLISFLVFQIGTILKIGV